MKTGHNQLRELAVELTAATADGSIAWSATEDEGAFQAEVRGALLVIEKVPGGPEEGPYLLTVLSQDACLVGSHGPDDALDQQRLRALWEAAFHSTGNAEQVRSGGVRARPPQGRQGKQGRQAREGDPRKATKAGRRVLSRAN